ncbi:MAG TPA: hypothetical protein VGQ30_11630 [Gemmatimonadaceae bacterium]|jgi:hypothetical protein|nr:hypothetical protein [Gemmatimonadaceae bacterium]
MNQRSALLLALAVHVVVIAVVLNTAHANAGTGGSGTVEGIAPTTTFSGMPVKTGFVANPIQIDDADYKGIDSAVVHVLAPDSVFRTRKDGGTAISMHPGSWVLIRVTKKGFSPITLRVMGNSPPAPRTIIRLYPALDSIPRG